MEIVTNSVMCGVFLSNNFYLMQMYTNKTNEKKNKHFFFPWYCDYAERQPFDEIKHRHTLKEVGDVAEGLSHVEVAADVHVDIGGVTAYR